MTKPARLTQEDARMTQTCEARIEGGRRCRGIEPNRIGGKPLVSIVTVCMNSAKTIAQTIGSIANQTYPNIEYIVVDGDSSDQTLEIIKQHSNIVDYYVSEPDDGLYYAMNKGITLSSGDYILFLNSDDWFEPDAVEELVNAMDYSGCDFVTALARYIKNDNSSHVLRHMPFDRSQYLRMSLRHETMLISAALYREVGDYDTRYRILSDREFAARLLKAGKTHYEIHRPLLNFRVSGISNTDRSSLRAEQDALLAETFSFLTPDERTALNDHAAATPETFISIANKHLDHPEFATACLDFLRDHDAKHGGKWSPSNVEAIGADRPSDYPRVSIILPFYSAEETIDASLRSARAQTIQDIEIICVNDQAIDNSQAVVDRHGAEDSRVKTVVNPVNIGHGASRNAGVRAARGRYVFHLDPDDAMPADALEHLLAAAEKHGSELVKGAFQMEQAQFGQQPRLTVKSPCPDNAPVINTTLKQRPEILRSTEGHWSILYESSFARRTPYPTDLKMGQDSIFIANAYVRARSITLIPDVVYTYKANPNSAMNTMGKRKIMDEIEWRRRAWHVLERNGFSKPADHLLFNYWNPHLFAQFDTVLSAEDKDEFFSALARAFQQTGRAHERRLTNPKTRDVLKREVLPRIRTPKKPEPFIPVADDALSIAVFTSRDHGGAGIASQRCVNALRRIGVDAVNHCIFQATGSAHVKLLPLKEGAPDRPNGSALLRALRREAVLQKHEAATLKAGELFSKAGAIVDQAELLSIMGRSDVVHLHWINGIVDFEKSASALRDKPIVWTLHDMYPFTGGCHYSEGCENFTGACNACPLLAGDRLANEEWRKKKRAFDQLNNLHIVSPSQWLADCAKRSSLFHDRPMHVIPNPLPADIYKPFNKIVARKRLGLPLQSKLILFGADSLSNHRKGGDLLHTAIRRMMRHGDLDRVECVLFGDQKLDTGVPTHSLGRISDEQKLALAYSAADVFAFPSREDNAPLTVAEAMLCGTPVVGFPVGNVPDLVEHRNTGYIARYADPNDFAEGLAWALTGRRSGHSLQRSMRCRDVARRHHDPDRIARLHEALYEEMLDTATARRATAQS